MTSYIYMLPLGEGHGPTGGVVTKPWVVSNHGFPCCWGTLSETFAKLSDSIYFVSPDGATLYANQFVSSRVRLDSLGVTVVQDAESYLTTPESPITFTVGAAN